MADIDSGRAHDLALRFSVEHYTNNYGDLFGKVDAVIIATPPHTHSGLTMDFLRHGIHVLCEKPLAYTVEDAELMLDESRKTGVHLAVGMTRRMFGGNKLVKDLIRSDTIRKVIGDVTRVDAEEGGEFNWPVTTAFLVRKQTAIHGQLFHSGIHLVDTLNWWFGRMDLLDYLDDGYNGLESESTVHARFTSMMPSVDATIKISSIRPLRNTILIEGTRGKIEVPLSEFESEVIYVWSGGKRHVVAFDTSIPYKNPVIHFADQLSLFCDSIMSAHRLYATPEEAVTTLEFINECYAVRGLIFNSWQM